MRVGGPADLLATAHNAFAIIYPKSGDTLVEGRTYIIRWHAPDTMSINLGAAMGGHDKGLLLDHAPAKPDTLVWSIPVGYVTGLYNTIFGRAPDPAGLKLQLQIPAMARRHLPDVPRRRLIMGRIRHKPV